MTLPTPIPEDSGVRCGFPGCQGPRWCNAATCPAMKPKQSPMTETSHPDEPAFQRAVYDFLDRRGICRCDGPSRASFDVGEGVECYRIVYQAYLFGASPDGPGPIDDTSHHIVGRFLSPVALAETVTARLSKMDLPAFLIWRKRPELYTEAGYLKAYMRFATTASPAHFVEAGEQFSKQEAEKLMGAVEMYPRPRPGEAIVVSCEPKTPASLAGCPECHQGGSAGAWMAATATAPSGPDGENCPPRATASPVIDMRGMLRRTTSAPDCEPDHDTEALFRAGRPIL